MQSVQHPENSEALTDSMLKLSSQSRESLVEGEDGDDEEWNDWEGTKCRPERWDPEGGTNESDKETSDASKLR